MDSLIKNQEDVSLSDTDIKLICNNKVEIVVYHDLDKYSSLKELMGQYGAVILLYETKRNFGHWVALIDYPNHIEFFDSYGLGPDEELNYAKYDDTPYLSQLISRSPKKVSYNKKRLQSVKEEVNTCGRWTALRVRMRDLNNNQFSQLFKGHQHYNGDFWVSALTFLYTFEKNV